MAVGRDIGAKYLEMFKPKGIINNPSDQVLRLLVEKAAGVGKTIYEREAQCQNISKH